MFIVWKQPHPLLFRKCCRNMKKFFVMNWGSWKEWLLHSTLMQKSPPRFCKAGKVLCIGNEWWWARLRYCQNVVCWFQFIVAIALVFVNLMGSLILGHSRMRLSWESFFLCFLTLLSPAGFNNVSLLTTVMAFTVDKTAFLCSVFSSAMIALQLDSVSPSPLLCGESLWMPLDLAFSSSREFLPASSTATVWLCQRWGLFLWVTVAESAGRWHHRPDDRATYHWELHQNQFP